MTIKREYTILPQGERDDFHHHVKESRVGVTSHYCCLFTLITLLIVFILAGVVTLTANMFYPEEITSTFGQFWYKSEAITTTGRTTLSSGESSLASWPPHGGLRNETGHHNQHHDNGSVSSSSISSHKHNATDHSERNNKTDESNSYHFHHYHTLTHHHNGSLSANITDSESELLDGLKNSTISDEQGTDMTDEDILQDLKERFAETMRDVEKRMENITGIRRAEFVVPIFMLICFLSFFTLISFCCCMVMRRRDNRRRKLFGKLITDLQTGDSKTVLLNQSDLDD